MSDLANNKTSYLVSGQLPEFVRRDHPLFVEFLENYYKFLEQDGELMYLTKRFPEFMDIDIISEDIKEDEAEGIHFEDERYHQILTKMYDNYIKYIPTDSLADLDVILKHSKDFYRSTGSEKSIRFLAHILFNKNADIYYPQQNILKASDGKWFVEKSINIRDVMVDNVANSTAYSRFANTTIRGEVSNSTCTVESISQYYDSGILVTELKVSSVQKDFLDGEKIFCTIEDEGVPKSLTGNVYSGIVTSVTLTDGGSGYIEGASVPVRSNNVLGVGVSNGAFANGFGAQVTIGKVAKGKLEGKIRDIDVVWGGAGYVVNDPLLFIPTSAGGQGAAGNVISVLADGTYHPAYYQIPSTTIADVANTVISNVAGSEITSNAYSNLATVYTNTSNLTISTNVGGVTLNVSLSKFMGNSNVYFETGDIIWVENTYQTITDSNRSDWHMTIKPGLNGGIANVPFTIYKKPNVNSVVADSILYWTYGPTGPIVACYVTNSGNGYFELPAVSVVPNTFIRSMGILGRMDIIDGGLNYQVGDQIEFINQYGTYGVGANGTVSSVEANGMITGVEFIAYPGHLPGGSGYRQDKLPRANVITTTGNGANVIVTACLGETGKVNARSNVIGTISTLKLLSGGFGYTSAPVIDLSTTGDGKAKAFANVVTGIYSYPGRYVNQDGQLSSYNFLQDRDYYQKYSYVVKIEESLNNYRKALKDLIHPAGLKLFGQYLYEDNNQTGIDTVGIANADSVIVNTNGFIVSYDCANNLPLPGNIWYNSVNTTQYANLSNGAYLYYTVESYSNTIGRNVSTNVVSSGVTFDGNNDSAIMSHTPSLNVSNSLTVITWFKVTDTSDTNRSIVSKTDTGYTRGFDFYNYAKNLEVVVRPLTTNNKIVLANNITSDTWTMGAFTYDGTTIRGYVNGVLTNTSVGFANSATDTDGSLRIGNRYSTNPNEANTMAGKIAIVHMYNRVLSNTEISRNFAKYRDRFGL
jgi:hypothetical protein